MNHDVPGTDPEKNQIIKDCLEESLHAVKTGEYQERFLYNNGQQTSELELEREFVDDLRPDKLKEYVQQTLLPTLRVSPGKVIRFGSGGISVRERHGA